MLGLLLVDHGSRRSEANAQLDDMAARVARLIPNVPLVAAHLEIAQPSIPEGVAQLLEQNVDDIAVLMYFLGDGRHVGTDVPAQVRAALAGRPDVRVRLGRALGPDDILAYLMLTRVGLQRGDDAH